MKLDILDSIVEVDYEDRSGNISVETKAAGNSKKKFPFYIDNGEKYIFKPLSKTKPQSTIMFTLSEVLNSYIAKKYFEPNSPQYKLAICKNISEYQPKSYEKGVYVPSYLNDNQKTLNLIDYLRNNPSNNNPINKNMVYGYHNSCGVTNINNGKYEYQLFSGPVLPSELDKYINYAMTIYNFESIFDIEIFLENNKYGEQLAIQYLLSLLTRNQNYHYENFNFKTSNGIIEGIVPPSDQEYSLMFVYPDQKEAHDLLVKNYKNILEADNFIKKTIQKISTNNREILEQFSEGLEKMIDDFSDLDIIFNCENFIGNMNSEAFFEYYYKYKLNNEVLSKRYKEKYCHTFNINLNDFFKQMTKEYIDSASQLKEIISNETISKTKIKKIN